MEKLSNNQYKYILRLIKNSHFRRKENKVFIEGENIVKELIENKPEIIEYILVSENLSPMSFPRRPKSPKESTAKKDIPQFAIPSSSIKRLTIRQSGFEYAAVLNLSKLNTKPPSNLGGFNVGLVEVQDPANVGTIFRTAEAFNVNSIVIFEGTADPLNQKSMDTSIGSVFRVPFFKVEGMDEMKKQFKNLQVIGTTSHTSTSYKDIKLKESSLILFGNEGRGLPKEALDKTDINITIPIQNIESLNISVSAGIITAHFNNI